MYDKLMNDHDIIVDTVSIVKSTYQLIFIGRITQVCLDVLNVNRIKITFLNRTPFRIVFKCNDS